MGNDDEFVEQLLAGSEGADDGPSSGPRLSEFTPEVEALYGAIDRLADVIAVTQAMGGKKPKRIPPVKRPVTAFDRLRQREQRRQHAALVARLLPDEVPDSESR